MQIKINPTIIMEVPIINGISILWLKNIEPIKPISIIPKADQIEYAKAVLKCFNERDRNQNDRK